MRIGGFAQRRDHGRVLCQTEIVVAGEVEQAATLTPQAHAVTLIDGKQAPTRMRGLALGVLAGESLTQRRTTHDFA